ncbi:MAG: hypothetical protein IPH34_04255 [Chitinophagaceae bacterium]|nr:hypothetical protein [Chitinophagaceae bacterium]
MPLNTESNYYYEDQQEINRIQNYIGSIGNSLQILFGPRTGLVRIFTVIAIALFAGFIMKQKDMSFLLPLAALFISDAVIRLLYTQDLFPYAGFYGGQWKNYLVLLAAVLIGWGLKGKKLSGILAAFIIAPTVFLCNI